MILLSSAFAAALVALQAPAASGQSPLSLEEALGIAERNAFSIRIAQSNVEQGRQRLSAAKANLGPRLSAGGTYTRYPEEKSVAFGGGSLVTQPLDNTVVSASLSMPIDIAGNLGRGVKASAASLEASRLQVGASTNDVRQNVKRAFFAVLKTEGLVAVATQALANSKERLATSEKLFAGDQIARVDLERIRTLVSQSESDLIGAQNGLQLTKQAFNLALARPVETPVELVPISSLPNIPEDADAAVATAHETRAEVRALDATIRALGFARRAQEATMNPSLSAAVNHQRNLGTTSGFGSSETTVGVLTLNVPIFDSGATRARVREARQAEEQAKINLQQVLLGISIEVRTALANLRSSKARLESAERQVALAEEVLRLAIIRQDAGEATPLEIVDATTSVASARNQAVTARYDVLTAYAELQHALGTDAVPGSGGNL